MSIVLSAPATPTAPALLLRPWRDGDAGALIEAYRDPVLRAWTRHPVTGPGQVTTCRPSRLVPATSTQEETMSFDRTKLFIDGGWAEPATTATLEVIKSEKLIENAAVQGERIKRAFSDMVERYELVKQVRGKGLMIGIEFGQPKSFALKASWNVLETASAGLFCQLITIPLFKDHKILTQVAGHGSHTIKMLPPYVITDDDCTWIENASMSASKG